jgi:UDP-N-acetylmuramyl pentapeptide synthase
LFTFGGFANEIGLGAIEMGFNRNNIIITNDRKELIDSINNIVMYGDSMLVKGSHSMRMEEIISALSHTVSAA